MPNTQGSTSTMQLGLASAAAIRGGASQLQPAESKWLGQQTTASTRGRQYGLLLKRGPHTKQMLGEANIDSPVSPCEREETRTRPWSVLSVVDLTWRRVQHRFLTKTWNLQGEGSPMRCRCRGSNVAGRVEMEYVGLHSAFPASLLRQACS